MRSFKCWRIEEEGKRGRREEKINKMRGWRAEGSQGTHTWGESLHVVTGSFV